VRSKRGERKKRHARLMAGGLRKREQRVFRAFLRTFQPVTPPRRRWLRKKKKKERGRSKNRNPAPAREKKGEFVTSERKKAIVSLPAGS